MIDLKASRRYARAFFELCEARGESDPIAGDFLKLGRLLERHPEISHLVLNSTISKSEKEDFIDKIFGSEIARPLIHFVKLLVAKKRFDVIRSIQKEFIALYEAKQGIQEVRVLTAAGLSQENERRLTAVLKKKLASEIRLIADTDPEIIGGMILRFGGKEIDGSYKNHLAELRQRLVA